MNPTDKPDFSGVLGSLKPDFSNVRGGVRSSEADRPPAGSLGDQTYTVASGDTLSHIATRFYGKPDWQPIFDANRGLLDDPDKIVPGQVLKIPAA